MKNKSKKMNSYGKVINPRDLGFYALYPSERFLVKSSSQTRYHYVFVNGNLHLKHFDFYKTKKTFY